MTKTAVLVTTAHKGVFFGYTDDPPTAQVVILSNARCAIRFGTKGGFLELADTGPTRDSRVGARAPEITLQAVTSVTKVSEAATKAWEAK